MSLPPLPHAPLGRPLRVIVLTCSDLGFGSAGALARAPGVELVAVVRAPGAAPKPLGKRFQLVWKRKGPVGTAAHLARKVLGPVLGVSGRPVPVPPPVGVRIVEVDGFRTPGGLAALRALDPDLAVVDGTNVLKEETFMLPRFGSVNLHCGRLPDYKGAPPGFWELLRGEREVGVTVHRVTAALDAGPILAQAVLPLDRAPEGDPMRYVEELWRRQLRPAGLALLCQVASAIAAGTVEERPQGITANPTFRFPDWRTVRALRRVVRSRRAGCEVAGAYDALVSPAASGR